MSKISAPPSSSGNLAIAKARMRKQTAIIRQKEADSHPQAAEQLAQYSHLLTNNFGSGVYAGYLPIRSEISPLPLIAALSKAVQATALPITPSEVGPLSFRLWRVGENLEDGPYRTRQPTTDGQLVQPDVILAPLLAFDDGGWRLGYGGGFYDRTIADLAARRHKVFVIGLGYDGQNVDKVPIGPHDMRLDAVLSPSGIHSPQL